MPPSPASPSSNGLSPEHQSVGISGSATPPRPSTGNGPPPTPTTNGEGRPETATTLSEGSQIPGAVTPSVTVTASEVSTILRFLYKGNMLIRLASNGCRRIHNSAANS